MIACTKDGKGIGNLGCLLLLSPSLKANCMYSMAGVSLADLH